MDKMDEMRTAQGNDGNDPQSPNKKTQDDKRIDMVSQFIASQVSSIISAILDAASATNNWIIVDRSNAKESSPTAEMLLEYDQQ